MKLDEIGWVTTKEGYWPHLDFVTADGRLARVWKYGDLFGIVVWPTGASYRDSGNFEHTTNELDALTAQCLLYDLVRKAS
jgi:hypothetical protein